MTVGPSARNLVAAIGLVVASVGSACGGSDDAAGGDSVVAAPTDTTSTEDVDRTVDRTVDRCINDDRRADDNGRRHPSPLRSGVVCFDGSIGLVSVEQAGDGTWIASGAAYELASTETLDDLGASDDFSEGIDESERAPFEFDCFDPTL